MKKLLIILIALVFCVGCTSENNQTYGDNQHTRIKIDDAVGDVGTIYKIEFQGHSYILWYGFHKGGLTHDPDCQCNKR